MIEFLIGIAICYVCNTLEQEYKTLKRLKDAKKKVFPQDRPTYENI